MTWLRKLPEWAAGVRSIGLVSRLRYAALALALAVLGWTVVMLVNTRRQGTQTQERAASLRRSVASLHLQAARRHDAAFLAAPALDEDASADKLVATVGEAARRAGMRLAQSRVVATPVSAQPAPAPAAQPGQAVAPQTPAPAPVDAGGVEFHLTGTYAALQRMFTALSRSRSRFQIVTLDVLRAKAAGTGAAQLAIRRVCIL